MACLGHTSKVKRQLKSEEHEITTKRKSTANANSTGNKTRATNLPVADNQQKTILDNPNKIKTKTPHSHAEPTRHTKHSAQKGNKRKQKQVRCKINARKPLKGGPIEITPIMTHNSSRLTNGRTFLITVKTNSTAHQHKHLWPVFKPNMMKIAEVKQESASEPQPLWYNKHKKGKKDKENSLEPSRGQTR